jgi:hypothetical protein
MELEKQEDCNFQRDCATGDNYLERAAVDLAIRRLGIRWI